MKIKQRCLDDISLEPFELTFYIKMGDDIVDSSAELIATVSNADFNYIILEDYEEEEEEE